MQLKASNSRPPWRFQRRLSCLLIGLIASVCTAQAQSVDLAHPPHFTSGVRAYPPPFLAVAKSPNLIASPGGGMNIQSDVGFLAGFSGFVDQSTGQLGFPGYRNHSIVNFAFDDDKLVIQMHVPYPEGRPLRAHNEGDLAGDDIFELLLEPRGPNGGKGRVYRIVGNAVGVRHADLDEPGVGQFHRPFDLGLRYASMLWDATGGWMASIAIPWDKLGGKPGEGAVWGVQCAVRYANPKIVAVLSPSDEFTDTSRFARLRFDWARRVNYRAHWMTEEAQSGHFILGLLLANGDTQPATVEVQVVLLKGDKEIARGSIQTTASLGSTYFEPPDGTRLSLPSQPANSEERDTVAHITAYDRTRAALIYDQWVPYWQREPGERDWLKTQLGKAFTFNIGPLPSLGIIDYVVNAQTLREANPSAHRFECFVSADGKEIKREEIILPQDGKLRGSLKVAFRDGVTYQVRAAIEDEDGKLISERSESFTRRVMPFETAPRAGLSDIVIAPFTAPKINGSAVSCWNRTYRHGANGLLEELTAANQNLLAAPATFKAALADGRTITLTGDQPQLKAQGRGQTTLRQTFRGGGLVVQVVGIFDYDGFYRFSTTFGPQAKPVQVKELRLEIPLQSAHATLIDAAVTWMHPGWEKSLGFLSAQAGRVWDSLSLPYQDSNRSSNMPPYLWVGDDERGLCYSNESDEGAHNDAKRPAAALDRSANAVVMKIWLVNAPLQLDKPRTFEFALQASPFKPRPTNAHLWRDQSRANGSYKRGVYFTNFWTEGAYPTYGRWLTLDYLKQQVQLNGCDRSGMMASACSESSGTPEYLQFFYEWGSPMGQFKRFVAPVPPDIEQRFKAAGVASNPFVMVEAASNTSRSNTDYRVWWLHQAAKNSGVSYVYQDNATWLYHDTPRGEYGYQREDGGREPTSMIWRSRTLMKRFAHAVTEAGQPSQPAIWPNLMSPALPGRAFCGKALTGEYTNSDQLRMGMLRVHLSQQWGMVMDWLCQPPSDAGRQIGATRKYWRALCSQLFLLDVTNFSRDDSAEITRRWWNALDVFWLDDPTLQWHSYYRNPTVEKVEHPATTLVSTYTAKGRALAVVSNQGGADTLESVRFKDMTSFGAPNLRYFYDAETAEEIEVENGALKLFVAGHDYRVIIGFAQPWRFAAGLRLTQGQPIPAQSGLDARVTLGEICRQLLTSRTLGPLPSAHRLTEAWAREILAQLPAASPDIVYLDAKATADVDLGDARLQCSVFYDRKRDFMLIGYFNGSDEDRTISAAVRDRLSAKVGKKSYNYVYDAIGGESQWSEIDVPAHRGRWEVCYADNPDYNGPRRGVFLPGTLMSNLLEAVKARKAQMEQP